jgi:hypothetical protein
MGLEYGQPNALHRNLRPLRLYLHIGMNKVASTAIQEALALNRRVLLDRHGILVPETGMGTADRGGKSHYFISEALGFTNDPAFLPPDAGRIAALRAELVSEIARIRPRAVVVSSEFFVLRRDVSRVRAFFEGYDTRILVYLRRHDAWLRSLFAQAIQSSAPPRWDRTLESFLACQERGLSQHLSYLELASAWSKAFGEDSLRLHPVVEGTDNRNVMADLFSAIGIDDLSGLAIPPRRFNVSPSAEALSVIDLLQRTNLPADRRAAAISVVLQRDDRGLRGLVLHPASRAQILRRYAPEYADLSARFRGGAPLFEVAERELLVDAAGGTALPPPALTPALRALLLRHLASEELSALSP